MYSNKEIWNVTYPIFLGLLAQNVINVTDTAFLGHVGEVALGAAAMGGLLYICIYTVAFGFSIGTQILIGRRNGEGNYGMIGPLMWQGSTFSLGMAVILLAALLPAADRLISMLVTQDAINQSTYDFFIVRVWGLLFSFVNVMFRALYIGITRTKVLTLNAVVMALVNVFLDYVMVFGKMGFPEMGVKGAALASVIAEASSMIFYMIYTYTKVDLKKYSLDHYGHFRMSNVMKILRISSFTMLQYFLAMAIWFVFFMAIERLGQRQLAIANIARSIYVVLLIPVQSLATSANTLVSNLIGAGGVGNVMKLLNRIALMSFVIIVAVVAVTAVFPETILAVYTSDASLVSESIPALYVVCVAMLLASFSFVYFNGISGTGNTQAALYIEIVVQTIYALYIIGVGMVLCLPVEICYTTEIVYYIVMFVLSFIYLKKGRWQDKKI